MDDSSSVSRDLLTPRSPCLWRRHVGVVHLEAGHGLTKLLLWEGAGGVAH
jgi:hypothetical protein